MCAKRELVQVCVKTSSPDLAKIPLVSFIVMGSVSVKCDVIVIRFASSDEKSGF